MGGDGSGRVARPAKLRLVDGRSEGRDSGGRKVKLPPRFTRGAPEAPDWITDDAVAMAEWSHVVEQFDQLEILSPAHATTLACYCSAVADLVRARKTLRREGRRVRNPDSGMQHPHPAVADERAARAEVHRWALQFGLTASAEQRFGVDPTEGGNDWRTNPFAGV
ncbi:phage terminase small subunit P27 family [Mycolicibacterium sp. 120270]|uniref:phage terminase small subunit P27 family n=1 Tax=Mycolicibacterium sp. 120270 TaxID=3090600 RepID=UPI00299DF484|nr:phage terminase small subunit P27 family [Mycolicibacterium sp. 120270]MDX1882253.1 phage terminase small subunit P27 family [Mycolicibacterium sp. 120270]